MMNCWLEENCKKSHCQDPNGCLIRYKLDYLYDQANISLNLRKPRRLYVDLDGTDLEEFKQLKNIQDNILDFVKDGKQLYIHSAQPGTGKTSWSLKLIQSFFNKIWLHTSMKCRGLFINVPAFLLALKDNIQTRSDYIQHIKDNIADCDLVIWDDIGNKYASEFEISHLLSMIDLRISAGKSNIYTSNISPEKLGELLDVRLASRIANSSLAIEFKGKDKRSLVIEGE